MNRTARVGEHTVAIEKQASRSRIDRAGALVDLRVLRIRRSGAAHASNSVRDLSGTAKTIDRWLVQRARGLPFWVKRGFVTPFWRDMDRFAPEASEADQNYNSAVCNSYTLTCNRVQFRRSNAISKMYLSKSAYESNTRYARDVELLVEERHLCLDIIWTGARREGRHSHGLARVRI
jgi:hypothetical protein